MDSHVISRSYVTTPTIEMRNAVNTKGVMSAYYEQENYPLEPITPDTLVRHFSFIGETNLERERLRSRRPYLMREPTQ